MSKGTCGIYEIRNLANKFDVGKTTIGAIIREENWPNVKIDE